MRYIWCMPNVTTDRSSEYLDRGATFLREEMLQAARWHGRDLANAYRGAQDVAPDVVDRFLAGSTGKGLRLIWEAVCRKSGWNPDGLAGVPWEACQMAFRRRMTGAD
jgi:hypothetical protein